MEDILLKNGQILNPKTNTNETGDIFIQNGIIKTIGGKISAKNSRLRIINLEGQWVMPGFIDTQASCGEPGREDVETIQEGALRAAKGGFAAIFLIPSSIPPVSNQAMVKFIIAEGKSSPIYIFPIGAITPKENSGKISEMYELKNVGCVAFSNGRKSIVNSLTMRRALEYSKMVGSIIYSFPDDPYLSNNGFANEDYIATEFGFRATPVESEQIAISRDIILAKISKGSIHIGSITSKGSCELIRQAKKQNVDITAFTAAHYLMLTDNILYEVFARGKVYPPFRNEDDRQALIQACKDGTLDIIISDHTPHLPFEVEQEIDNAPFGISSLETTVAVAVESLIHEAGLDPMIIPTLFSLNPSKRFALPMGSILEGQEANITCLDPNKKTLVTTDCFAGRCFNNPFLDRELRGFPTTLIAKGRIVLEKGELS